MNRILRLNAFVLILLLSSCNNPTGNAQQNLPANSETNTETILLFNGTSLTDTAICCDTVTHAADKSFVYGRCIRLPRLNGNSAALAKLNERISSDYKSLIGLCGKEIMDHEHFLKVSYQYFVEDSLLSLVIETQNAWHLSEGTSEYNVYHYDMKNNRTIDTRGMLELWGMSQVPLLNAIAEQVSMPPDHTEPLFQTAWFNSIKWKDINQLKVYKNNNKQLFIVYPVVENGIEASQIIE